MHPNARRTGAGLEVVPRNWEASFRDRSAHVSAVTVTRHRHMASSSPPRQTLPDRAGIRAISIPVPGPSYFNTLTACCWFGASGLEKDSNLRHLAFQANALPIELSMEQTTGFEPMTSGGYPALYH